MLWCTFLLDPQGSTTPPRVAFAIGRAHGPAVTRNTVRRRLRAMLQAASSVGHLPPGEYLFGGRPGIGERSSTELQFDLDQLLRRLHD